MIGRVQRGLKVLKKVFGKFCRFLAGVHRFIIGSFLFLAYTGVFVTAFFIVKGRRGEEKHLEKPFILQVSLSKTLKEIETGFSSQGISFVRRLVALRHAIDDPNVKGVLVEAGDISIGLAQMQEMHRILLELRKKKPVYCYLSSAGASLYALSSGCTKIFLQPMGELSLKGLFTEQFYFKKLLDFMGVEGFFVGKEEYKSGVEPFSLEKMSGPVRENYESLFKEIEQTLEEVVSKGRPQVKSVEKTLLEGPYAIGQALSRKLIDGALPLFGVRAEIQSKLKVKKEDDPLPMMPLTQYMGVLWEKSKRTSKKGKKVAVVIMEGEIVRGSLEHEGGAFDNRSDIEAYRVLETLGDISQDKDVGAVIVRINTGGGEVVASEVIREGLMLLKAQGKKIIVSMGDVTASGGYWIATAADEIIADSGTITGSIGVFGGRFTGEKLLKKIGVGVSSLGTTSKASFDRSLEKMSPEEKKFMEKRINETYGVFLELVSKTRKMSFEEARTVAKGRIWSGRQALTHKLVDRIGGFFTAADRAVALAKIDPKNLRFEFFPREKTIWMVLKMLLFGEGDRQAALNLGNFFLFLSKRGQEEFLNLLAEQRRSKLFLKAQAIPSEKG